MVYNIKTFNFRKQIVMLVDVTKASDVCTLNFSHGVCRSKLRTNSLHRHTAELNNICALGSFSTLLAP